MANGFRSIPSLVGQLAAAKQIEAQEQNILASQIAAATQQERLNQLQSPQNQALLQLQQQLGLQQAQAELAGLPLQREQQELTIQKLRQQLDPNYQAQQDAAKLAFDVNRARQLGQVERELAIPKQTELKFTETDTEIVTQDPFTGEVRARIPKDPKTIYQQTTRGLFAGTDPTNLKLIPGTEPISEGTTAQPIRDPADPNKILGYTVPKGFQSLADLKIAPQAPGSDFRGERDVRNLKSITELKSAVSPFTTGVGSLLSYVPGTSATDFEANVDTLKANIAFSELQAMREASKTGGALGQVAVRELDLLQSALGALNPRQSPGSFRNNLDKIEKSILNFQQARGQTQGGGGSTVAPSGKIKIFAPDGKPGLWDASKPIPSGYKTSP